MKTALLSALLLLTLVLSGGVLVLVYDAHQDLAAAHLVIGDLRSTTQQIGPKLALLGDKVNEAADTLNDAATEERANWKKTSKEAGDTGYALRLLIDSIDKSLVHGTLHHVNTQTLPAIDAQISGNGNQLKLTLAKLGDSADGLTAVERTLNLRLDDPQIPALLGHFKATAANLETISANGAAMSGDMKLAVHRMAQPPTKLHQALSVAWTTAKFGSLFVP